MKTQAYRVFWCIDFFSFFQLIEEDFNDNNIKFINLQDGNVESCKNNTTTVK